MRRCLSSLPFLAFFFFSGFLGLPGVSDLKEASGQLRSQPQGQRLGGGIGRLGGVEPEGKYPSPQYYLGLEVYRTGDLEQAVDVLESALRNSRRDINGRWVDAIPPLALLAECYWHLGDLGTSKEYLDQAFQIAIRYRGWLGRCGFQGVMQTGVARTSPRGLWREAAAVRVIPVSDRIMYRSGDRLTEQRLKQGGRIQEESIRPMNVVEIMRTLAVAAHRRRVILGPLAKEESMALALIDSTKYPAKMRIPLARSLIGAMRTVEHFSNHNDKRVVEEAVKTAMPGGGAHPLTPIVLIAQAHTMTAGNQPAVVLDITAAAANTAAALRQPEWIGEAMQLAAGCADPAQAAAVAKMAGVAAVATSRQSRLASLHCLIAAADASVTAGDSNSAEKFLSEAQALSGRRNVLLPRLDAYGAYVAARIAASQGSSIGAPQITPTDQAISRIREFAFNHRSRKRALVSMPRSFQWRLIRASMGNSNSVGGKTGDALLAAYASDPPVEVWRRDAVDALAACMADRSGARSARVQLAAANSHAESFLVASDALLAGRFLDRLPLGGRLAQVRSLVSREDALLSDEALAARADAPEVMQRLLSHARRAGQPNAVTTEEMEAQAASLALARVSYPAIAIPPLDSGKPTVKLPKRTGLLTFVAVGNKVHASLAAEGKVVMWNIAHANRLPGEIGRLLKGIGVGKSRGRRIPEDDSWKELAVSLRQHLFPDDAAITPERFDHLIVVADGPLWYLPLELLPLKPSSQDDETSSLLGDQIAVRYAATPGLALTPVAPPRDQSHRRFCTGSILCTTRL